MKYTADEAFEEIKKRGRHLKLEHEVRLARLTGALSCVVSLALLGFVRVFSGSEMGSDTSKHYVSFILSAKSGLYILLAVIFFVLGVSVTLTIQHYKKQKGEFSGKNNS